MPLLHAETVSPYLRLYHQAKRLAWNPADIDLSHDRASWEHIQRDYATEQYAQQILQLSALFYAGEESVTHTLSPFLSAIARAGLGIDRELFLTSQLFEEAKHFEFFSRYVREVFGEDPASLAHLVAAAPQAVLIEDLDHIATRIRHEDDVTRLRPLLVEGITHYMGVVEAMLARTGYVGAHEALAARGWLPGLQEGFRLIRRDEGRHVAFGIRVIRDLCAETPAHADIVMDTFNRHLPNVLATVQTFNFPHPIVDLEKLQHFAIGAYQQFVAAAGLSDDAEALTALEVELAEQE